MKIPEYKACVIDNKIDTHLKVFGALLIEGPKWYSKTGTGMFHSNSQFSWQTLKVILIIKELPRWIMI